MVRLSDSQKLSEKGINGVNMAGSVRKEATGFADIVRLVSWRLGGKGTFQTDPQKPDLRSLVLIKQASTQTRKDAMFAPP